MLSHIILRLATKFVVCIALLNASIHTAFGQSDASIMPAPDNAHALVYSTTAAELFFTPQAGYLTRITHNGRDRGTTDSRSLWLDGLDPSISHRFELHSVDPAGAKRLQSAVAVLTLFTGDFVPPVYRVEAINSVLTGDDLVNTGSGPEVSLSSEDNVSPVDPEPELALNSDTMSAASEAEVAEVASACNVSSINDLVNCANEASRFDVINVRRDLSCSNGNCCPSGNALLQLRGVDRLTIEGNGKRLLREAGHRQCSLIDIIGGKSIKLKDWVLDDDVNTPGCQVGDNCPRMIHVRSAHSISLDNVTVQNGKGYTIYIDQVNGFEFIDSRLINSGVLGLYIGHGNRASTNVRVENSTFVDNQTNALALLGVTGGDPSVNRIINNRFLRNHRRGQWPVAPQFGTGLTGGGQVYLAQASGVTFENNLIRDGYCDNCFVQKRARSGVTGLELGIPGRSTVSAMFINNNLIENHDGFGIHSNANSRLPGNVRIQNNKLLTNTVGIGVQGGAASDNTVRDTRWFQSFEGGNDLDTQFSVESSCPGAAVRRVCGSADARHGSCLAEITTSEPCSATPVRLTTRPQSVSSTQRIQAAAWVKGTQGDWCLMFSNNGRAVAERCVALQTTLASTVGNALGTPDLSVSVPSGANQVAAELRVTQGGARMLIDDVKLSGF